MLIRCYSANAQDFGIRTVVVSSIPPAEAGVTVGDQYEWDEVWQSWPDIDTKNGTIDIDSLAYFPGAPSPNRRQGS